MARKVLLADDSVAVQKAVEASLEPKDFEVFSVSRGAEVVEEARRIHPDVILLDGDLPDVDGYEICRRVKEDPDLMGIPVVLMSAAESGEDDLARARWVGADGHIAKPFQGKELTQRVLSLMDLTVEPTVKIDTSDMEVLDFEGDQEGESEDLELGELDMEDEGVLELTEEMEATEGVAAEADLQEEFTFDEHGELDLGAPSASSGPRRGVKTEELEEISFEEEIEELDLGELELDGAEEIPSLEAELGMTSESGPITATDEVDAGISFDEDLSLGTGDFPGEVDLLGTEEAGGGLLLDTEEGMPAGASSQPPKGLIDTDELEAVSLDDEDLVLETGSGEPFALEDLGETSIDFDVPEEGGLEETREEFAAPEERLELKREAAPVEEEVDLEETVIEWEEPEAPPAAKVSLEETSIEWEDLGEAEADFPQAAEEPVPEAWMEEAPPVGPAVTPVTPAMVAAQPPEAPRARFEVLEEVALEEDIASAKMEREMAEAGAEPEFRELSLSDVPSLEAGLRLELTEEDFGVVDPFSEDGMRKELARNLQDMVERILSEMAPPIVERVAREIALERTERIVLEEIERLKLQPEGV
jgi:DNA-binding response OmpR family regulator